MIRTSEISNPKTAHSEGIIYLKGRSPPGPGPTVHIDHLTNAPSPVEVEKVATAATGATLKVFILQIDNDSNLQLLNGNHCHPASVGSHPNVQ